MRLWEYGLWWLVLAGTIWVAWLLVNKHGWPVELGAP